MRHEFLATLCTKKGSPSSAAWSLILTTLTGTMHMFEHFIGTHDTALTAAFLRVPDPNADRSSKWNRVSNPFAGVIAATPASRRWQILLALTCAAYEQQVMGDSAWRGEPSPHTTEWLSFLKSQGYVLSDIETKTLAKGQERAQRRAADLAAQKTEGTQDEEVEPVAA
ncbi:hypothetical protein AB0I84_40455 [Streptomyces spectabilis]|uniref:hypothetical protein n=1 Tax=Streptomyces spectabilis TaxID=68270 RepID=UPI0033C7CD6C